MPNYPSFGGFSADLRKFEVELGVAGARRIAAEMGKRAQAIATREASADLGGDPKFSGWAPTLDTKVRELDPGRVLLTPTRASAGPWTVAQFGRNQGNASGFSGPGLNHRTGVTSRTKTGKIRMRKTAARRWNGYTKGKGTADSVHAAIETEIQEIAEKGTRSVVKRYFDSF